MLLGPPATKLSSEQSHPPAGLRSLHAPLVKDWHVSRILVTGISAPPLASARVTVTQLRYQAHKVVIVTCTAADRACHVQARCRCRV